MLKTIVFTMATYMLIINAHADAIVLENTGQWGTNFHPENSDGHPMCVMSTEIEDIKASFMIKYFPIDDSYEIQTFKDSWNIPSDTRTEIQLEFDRMGPWTLLGGSQYASSSMGFNITYNFGDKAQASVNLFFLEFSNASRLVVTFAGNEPNWTLGLRGSKVNALAFARCTELSKILAKEKGLLKDTQPFSEKTQPFNKQNESDTQPFQTSPNPSGSNIRFF